MSTALKTFDNQPKIPRLPIPTLENLAQKYLDSCKPLLSEEEFATTEQAVREFVQPGGLGETLQNRLKDYDKTQKVASYLLSTFHKIRNADVPFKQNSWLEEIWLNKAYL